MSEKILTEGIEEHLGERLRSARPMGGGCIGEVYKVELGDGTTLVAKVNREGASHLEREAYMLRYLRERSELPVPEVYHGSKTLLLMEFVEGSAASPQEPSATPPSCLRGCTVSRPAPTATSGTRSSGVWRAG